MKKYFGMILVFWGLFSIQAHAIDVKDVGIRYVGIYANGRIFASLDKTIPVPGCADATWIQIDANHPHKNDFYSLLLSAHAAKKKLDVNLTACLGGQATLANDSSDYIIVK